MNRVCPLRCRPLIRIVKPEAVGHVDAPHDQDSAILFNLADGLLCQVPLPSRYPARFKSAAQRAGQSAGSS